MNVSDVLEWLIENGTDQERAKLSRYGIPDERAHGISVGTLKKLARRIGRNHDLAVGLWDTGWYEARMLAAFVDAPDRVTAAQMDAWTYDFDSWAICDTTCFHLFDRTQFAWAKVEPWSAAPEEFVRRAAYALIWALSAHAKDAPDARFLRALDIIEHAEPDPRPLVKKAVDMALRATGKRNPALNRAALEVAERLAGSDAPDKAWIGRHAGRELLEAKVRSR